MAIKGAVRWKPDVYRSSTNSTVADLILPGPGGYQPPAGQGGQLPPVQTDPSGKIIMIAQAVTFDDTKFNAQNLYRAGHVESEIFIDVLFERVYQKELAEFIGKTYAEGEAIWDAQLEAFKNWVAPHGTLLVTAIRSARRAPFKLV